MQLTNWIDSAETLMERLDGGPLVSGLVPSGFERYLRIFSPVPVSNNPEPGALELQLPWSLICEQLGVELKPNTFWQRDIVAADPRIADFQGPGFDTRDTRVLERVGEVLQRFERVDRSWYFASWVGFGVAEGGQPVWFPTHHHDALEMSIFERWNEAANSFTVPLVPGNPRSWTPLSVFGDGVPASIDPPDQLPMYWWPDGQEWVIGQALYGRSLYLACNNAVADAVLSTPGVETMEVASCDEAEHEE
ncbi:hypothetical protein JOF28_002426 [Leucobacter exalbidus]|uniref:Uncharacterized protein n=1 Tax=Leucobacter exalbidus TaxID=662960 RepID=A0A940T4U7_9MICO|nr:hypothetical protein [Leucobacter exalbidus]MBP1327194.1 hypothetical protein [Leucobacter exalbidus]